MQKVTLFKLGIFNSIEKINKRINEIIQSGYTLSTVLFSANSKFVIATFISNEFSNVLTTLQLKDNKTSPDGSDWH